MTLTADERERLDVLIDVVVHSMARDDISFVDEDAYYRNTRELLSGFLAGYLYHDRRGGPVTPEELMEIRNLLYGRSADLRDAVGPVTQPEPTL